VGFVAARPQARLQALASITRVHPLARHMQRDVTARIDRMPPRLVDCQQSHPTYARRIVGRGSLAALMHLRTTPEEAIMATPTPAADTKLMPKSGFGSPQFILGLLAVVGTFLLGQFGLKIQQILPSNILQFVQNVLSHNDFVVGAIVVAAIAGLIALSSYIETNTVKTKGPPAKGSRPAAVIGRPFYQTSEFWLGLLTVVLNYLHDSGILAPDVHNSTDTATLLIALVYTFARSQLKQAYANAQAQGT
jgi:hypothetical protein